MTQNQHIEPLNRDDVIKLKNEKQKLPNSHTLFTVKDCTYGITNSLQTGSSEIEEWSKNGVEAEVLVVGKHWRKGKIRLSIEFIPDESEIESPLDDFRQKTNL
ncbi:KGK domain-containing protein [Cyanobacterium aponinum UTEX 3222]|uniref:KGK domain-containing protein n=1 Tax=Cyanobacterium aponinum TaxID=379064 RepID=UPI00308F7CC1|nr:KGK domain-containing protein [Cyanobacterium aponinum UTEX 3222]